MSSVSPSSSASNEARPMDVSSLEVVVACLGEIRRSVEIGMLDNAEGAAMMKQVFPAYHSYLRKMSGTSSSQVSAVTASTSNSRWGSGGRLSSISKMKSWRPVATSSPLSEASPGYCYLQAIRGCDQAGVGESLGSCPSLFSIMGTDISKFRSIPELQQLKIVGDRRTAHLEKVNGHGNFVREMTKLAKCSVPALTSSDTLWHALRTRLDFDDGVSALYSGTTSLGLEDSSLQSWLANGTGVQGGVHLPEDVLRLITKSAAMLDEQGKRKLRSLEAVGDSALTALLALDNYLQGGSVQRFQDLRSHVTNNKVLAQCFCSKLPQGAVTFVGGVDPSAGVVGAKALESILGAIWIHSGLKDFALVVESLGLVDFQLRVV